MRTLLPASLMGFVAGILAAPPQMIFGGNDGCKKGAIATESKECSKIGRDLIARGGNAVDALVGSTLCVGVVGMYHSGIGGGGFMLVRGSDGTVEAVDFRETAPAAASEEMYRGNKNGSMYGGLAVAVPGELKGLEYVHQKYGALPWNEVVMPSAHIARDGFRVSHDLVRYMNYSLMDVEYNFLVDDPEWAVDFAPNGTLIGEGDWITRKRYAGTLEMIAEHGTDVFYAGAIAKSMIEAIQKKNGTMTLDDLRTYNISAGVPLSTTYRGKYRVYTTPSPASGAVALQILKIMEQYPNQEVPVDNTSPYYSPEARDLTYHRLDEAMRFAYATRRFLGDPAFVHNTSELESHMLDPGVLREIRHKILDDRTQHPDAYNPDEVYPPDSHGTSYIVTADSSGMAASLTTTINTYFASTVMDPVSGVILNNEMDDFSVPDRDNYFGYPPAIANFIRPGKRPLSSISPFIIERIDEGSASSPADLLFAVMGAAGGSRIASSTAQVAWRVLEHGSSMASALVQRRIHDQLLPNKTFLERGFDEQVVRSLEMRGHQIAWLGEGLSSIHGITRDEEGRFQAASEPRQENSAGYTV